MEIKEAIFLIASLEFRYSSGGERTSTLHNLIDLIEPPNLINKIN
jgi:hypothetical protein